MEDLEKEKERQARAQEQLPLLRKCNSSVNLRNLSLADISGMERHNGPVLKQDEPSHDLPVHTSETVNPVISDPSDVGSDVLRREHRSLDGGKDAAATQVVKVPSAGTAFVNAASSETMSQHSTDSTPSSLADELNKLGHLVEPDNPFRTAAVLRDAVVGLGTLTRRLNELIEGDPVVADCPSDVEMLVRRAGELYGSLQEFATSKGIPVSQDMAKGRKRCNSNPEFLFEDDAPWLDSKALAGAAEPFGVNDDSFPSLEKGSGV